MKVLTRIMTVLLLIGVATVAVPVPAHAATQTQTPCVKRVLRKGSNNTCVGYVQTMLNKANSASLQVDNDFGPKTKAAVTKWQANEQKSNSSMLVDGIVGPQTWGTLCAQKAKYVQTAKDAGCDKAPKPAACTQQTFSTRRNYVHPCVGNIQTMMNLIDGAMLTVDNNYGTRTRNAVASFQSDKKIKDDGIVGPQTWKKLCANKSGTKAVQELYKEVAKQAGCKV